MLGARIPVTEYTRRRWAVQLPIHDLHDSSNVASSERFDRISNTRASRSQQRKGFDSPPTIHCVRDEVRHLTIRLVKAGVYLI